ncbi:MAG: YebC/PmpR family DNA-binding transcriptional regulator [Patescibacteria group bacterium]
MARHSKWHNIQVRKGAVDKKRGKAFTKHAKLIEVAAREGGGDTVTNATLRTAIENAKMDNVPNANIERAVKKGTGELKDDTVIIEAFLEGYGPSGVAFYVQVLTDKRNRAVGNVKTILSKNGGAMGEAGSVGWMFDRRGVMMIDTPAGTDIDTLQLTAIDAGAQDVRVEDDHIVVFTPDVDLHRIQKKLSDAGHKVSSAELTFAPKTEIQITELAKAQEILNLIDLLEEDEDVTNVYTNLDIAPEVLEKL